MKHKRFRITAPAVPHQSTVDYTDHVLEAHLRLDEMDPLFLVSWVAVQTELTCEEVVSLCAVKEFRGERYVPYSDMVNAAKHRDAFKVFLPASTLYSPSGSV